MRKMESLRVFCAKLFGRNNLIGTDIEDISAEPVRREFEQDEAGIRVAFTVSNHFLGKIMDEELAEARGYLVADEIHLKIEHHPSGRYTLMERLGDEGTYRDCRGELLTNLDRGEFFRAVYREIKMLIDDGKRVVLEDFSDENE